MHIFAKNQTSFNISSLIHKFSMTLLFEESYNFGKNGDKRVKS